MARFIGFGDSLLIEVDWLASVRWTAKPESLGHDNATVFFDWKDGSQTDYACTPEQWKKLRAFFVAQGFVLEI